MNKSQTDRLRQAREQTGLNQAETAKASGITQKDISLLEGGKKKFIPPEYIHFLYNQGIDLNWLFEGKKTSTSIEQKQTTSIKSKSFNPTVVTVDTAGRNAIVQVDTKAAAGLPANFDNPEYFKNLPAFHLPDPQFRIGTFMRIQISGDSMHPTIKHKDWVFAELLHDFADIRDGYIHIILTRDGVVAKRILNRIDKRSKLVLQSDNTSYSTYEEDIDDVLQIWKVHAKLSFDLGNDNADLRKDINWLKAEMIELKGKIK